MIYVFDSSSKISSEPKPAFKMSLHSQTRVGAEYCHRKSLSVLDRQQDSSCKDTKLIPNEQNWPWTRTLNNQGQDGVELNTECIAHFSFLSGAKPYLA